MVVLNQLKRIKDIITSKIFTVIKLNALTKLYNKFCTTDPLIAFCKPRYQFTIGSTLKQSLKNLPHKLALTHHATPIRAKAADCILETNC